MEHVYEVRQIGPYSWAAACVTHMTAAVSHTEGKAEKYLLRKCMEKETEQFNVRIVDTRSMEKKIYDFYQEEAEDNGT